MTIRVPFALTCLLSLVVAACSSSGSGGTTPFSATAASATGTASATASGSGSASTTASGTGSASGTASASGTGGASSSTTGNSGTGNTTITTGSGNEGHCLFSCSSDSDCTKSSQDVGSTCQNGVCASATPPCTTDAGCIGQVSGWPAGSPCTADSACDNQVCVDVGGGDGHCVSGPNSPVNCVDEMTDTVMATDIDGSSVMVCGNAKAACNQTTGVCFVGCQSDADCTIGAYPHCNPTTKACECSSDSDCASIGTEGMTTCNSGTCGCSTDAECVASMRGDVCASDGTCGCSGDAACSGVMDPYDGGSVFCG